MAAICHRNLSPLHFIWGLEAWIVHKLPGSALLGVDLLSDAATEGVGCRSRLSALGPCTRRLEILDQTSDLDIPTPRSRAVTLSRPVICFLQGFIQTPDSVEYFSGCKSKNMRSMKIRHSLHQNNIHIYN